MSRINVFARVRQSIKGESGEKLKLQNDRSLAQSASHQHANSPSPSVDTFHHVFESSRKLEDVYTACISDLLTPFFGGYNTALVVLGETDSGQIKTIMGGEIGNILKSSKKSTGLLAMLVDDLFKKRSEIEKQKNCTVTLKLTILEIDGDDINDLMVLSDGNEDRNAADDGPCLAESELEGTVLKNCVQLEVIGTKDCLTMVEAALGKTPFCQEESNANAENKTLLIQFEMNSMKPTPIASWLRIFKLPGGEKLMLTPPTDASNPQNGLQDIHSFGNIVMHLSECDTNYQVPNYRVTILAALMTDALGGNCYTNCLTTFKPIKTPASSIIMRYALRMKRIINYPTQNSLELKNILRRYRWMMKKLQSNLIEERQKNRAYVEELKRSIKLMENKVREVEEQMVEDKAEKSALEYQLANANHKFAEITSSKTNMSSRMVSSEQEKLKLSKEIVDLQIVNNTIKQEAEKQIFQLKQKNLDLEDKISDLERHFALEKRGHQDQRDRASHIKQEFQDLSEEYINLKGNFTSLSEDHQSLVKTNKRLVEEIADLADTKDQILKHKNHMEIQQLQTFTDRLRAIATRVSEETNHKSSSSCRVKSSNSMNLELEKQLLYNVQEREEQLETIRKEHGMELKKLEDKLVTLKEDLKESKEQAERYKLKMAEQNSELLIATEQKKQLEELCNKLEEKLKETSNEYVIRLEKYISDIKDFIGNQQWQTDNQEVQESLKQVDNLVDGLKKGYIADNEILERKLKRLTVYITEILQRHEQLLTAYKLIMWKTGVGSQTDDNVERDFSITLPPIEEIESEQMKEKNDLRTKLYLSEQNIKELYHQIDHLKDKLKEAKSDNVQDGDKDNGNIDFRSVRKDMRNFTVNVQLELEQERAELLTRCTLAEQQVAEYEEYMETYIRRYQHEIVNLRKLLTESGRHHSADGALGLEYRHPRPLPPLQDDRRAKTRYKDLRY